MDGGPVDRPVPVPDGEVVADGERLAVADDHALDLPAERHPGPDVGVHARTGEADLVAGPVRVGVGAWWQPAFVGAPAELGGGGPLLEEPGDRPGVDELADLLGAVADLGVPLGDVDHLGAGLHGQAGEVRLGQSGRQPGPAGGVQRGRQPVGLRQHRGGDVGERDLGPVAHQPGVGAVLDHGGGAVLAPGRRPAPEVDVPDVQGAVGGVGRRVVGEGVVPQLHRGVDVQDAVVLAPLDEVAGVDVPGEVDEQVTGAEPAAQGGVQVPGRDPVPDDARAGLHEVGVRGGAVVEVQHGQLCQVHVQVAEQQRLEAARHRPAAEQQQPPPQRDPRLGDRDPGGRLVGARVAGGAAPDGRAAAEGAELGEAGSGSSVGSRAGAREAHVVSDLWRATTRMVARDGSAGPQTYMPFALPLAR